MAVDDSGCCRKVGGCSWEEDVDCGCSLVGGCSWEEVRMSNQWENCCYYLERKVNVENGVSSWEDGGIQSVDGPVDAQNSSWVVDNYQEKYTNDLNFVVAGRIHHCEMVARCSIHQKERVNYHL